jgi:hypothetical protein
LLQTPPVEFTAAGDLEHPTLSQTSPLYLVHLPDPFSCPILQPNEPPVITRSACISSRRPHLRLEAIEEIDHAFELAVLSCIPS